MKKLSQFSGIFFVLLAGLFFSLLFSCKKEEVKVVPIVVASSVVNITETTAVCGGEISSDGGADVTSRGVCWSLNANPTTSDKKTIDGVGKGTFNSSITGLTPGGTYYLRAYAGNSVGTAYSSQVIFTALASEVALTTKSLSLVTTTSAACGGAISTDGGAAVTARGVCWNTSANPTIANSKTSDGTGPGLYTSSITGLTKNTLYYIRAYATNSVGTSYGDEILLKTFTGTVTDVENNVYNTVTIGTQVWMAENLRTTKYNDGTSITLVADGVAWAALTTEGYCWYNNDKATYKTPYGGLYNWYAVNPANNGGKNVCPEGWKVPGDDQWTSLADFLGGNMGSGGRLKEAGMEHWLSPNTGATNETGFTALPGGNRSANGEYVGINTGGNWWSLTEYEINSAWNRYLNSANSHVHPQFWGKRNGVSVRCIKDL